MRAIDFFFIFPLLARPGGAAAWHFAWVISHDTKVLKLPAIQVPATLGTRQCTALEHMICPRRFCHDMFLVKREIGHDVFVWCGFSLHFHLFPHTSWNQPPHELFFSVVVSNRQRPHKEQALYHMSYSLSTRVATNGTRPIRSIRKSVLKSEKEKLLRVQCVCNSHPER